MRFKDKVVVITGASQNTGVAIADQFLKEGAKVLISSNVSGDLNDVYQSFLKDYPTQIHQFVADISNKQDVEGLFTYLDHNLNSRPLKRY